MADSGQDSTLNCGAIGDSFIWIDTPAQLPATKELLQYVLHHRDARRASNEDHVVDLLGVKLGILQHALYGLQGFVEVRLVQ
mmetsp:Transcript_33364/g.53790  ORF Transcript_33364/g.53790 Transcript_33364/m.53790 type:complete len:82 (+) Transcript_33364:686-931(+)